MEQHTKESRNKDLHAPMRMLYPQPLSGGLAERLRSGLQIREDRFDSGTRLQIPSVLIVTFTSRAAMG